MSVTTTANPATTHLSHALVDYDIKLTGAAAEGQPAPVNQRSVPPTEYPEGWPTHFNNVPPYRPVNRSLNNGERPGGMNGPERVFIAVMLHGVWLNATVAQAWRKTGGRLNSNIFRYAIGGEW